MPHRATPPSVLAIGVSTGGPAALDVLLPALPADFPLAGADRAAHAGAVYPAACRAARTAAAALRVREAAEGDADRPRQRSTSRAATGTWRSWPRLALGAPATLHLHQGPPENHCRPAVDVLFRSAASGLRFRRAGRGAHRHGFRRLDGLPHDSRAGRQRAGAGPGHQHGVGNAGRGGQGGPGAQGCFRSSDIAPEILRLAGRGPPLTKQARDARIWNRWSSHGNSHRGRRLRLSSPTRLRPLAKRARPLARLPLRNAALEAAAQPGHDAPGRTGAAACASRKIPRWNAPSPRP